MGFFCRFRRGGGCAELAIASSITTQNNFWYITILPEKSTPDFDGKRTSKSASAGSPYRGSVTSVFEVNAPIFNNR